MDGEAGRVVRGLTVAREGAALRGAGVILAACLSLAALANAWAATTRTTATAGGWMIYRENLLTGRGEFCAPTNDGQAVRCIVARD